MNGVLKMNETGWLLPDETYIQTDGEHVPPSEDAIKVSLRPAFYYNYDRINNVWVLDTQTETLELSELSRFERYTLLAEVDAIAGNFIRWSALSREQQDAWVAYREVLLDVPQQAGFPHDIEWPTNPTAVTSATPTPTEELATERKYMSCTRQQGKIALGAQKWASLMALVADPAIPWGLRVAIDDTPIWHRTDGDMQALIWAMNLTEEEADDLFRLAATL